MAVLTRPASQPASLDVAEWVKHDPLVSSVAFALILTVIQRLVGFLRNILLCKFLTADQLGQWSLVFSFLFLIAPMTVLGLPGCFGRFVEHYQLRGQLGAFLSRISWICGLCTIAFSVFLCVQPQVLAWIIFRDTSEVTIVYAIAGTLVSVTLINYMTSLMEALCQVRTVTIMRFISAVGFTIASLSFLCFSEHATAAVTWGLGAGSLIACVPAFWVLWTNRSLFGAQTVELPSSNMWRRIAPYAAWMWGCNLLQNASEVSDRYMLIHCSPVPAKVAQAFVGQYHGARIIPLVLVGIATMLGGVLMPYMTAHWERNEPQKVKAQINWTIKLVALGFTIVGAAVLVFAPFLFDVILEGRYSNGLAVLPLTLVYSTWFSLFIVGKDFLWVTERGKWAVGVAAIGLGVNLFLNWALIPFLGLWGAVTATTIANGLTLCGIFLLNNRFGARPDLGCWLATIVGPLALLTGQWCLPLVSILVVATGMTTFVLNKDEFEQVDTMLKNIIDRAKNVL